LWLQFGIITVEADQVMQSESCLGALDDLPVRPTSGQVGVSISCVGRHLIKVDIDFRGSRAGTLGANRRDRSAGHVAADGCLQHLTESRGNGGYGQEVAHRRSPLDRLRYSSSDGAAPDRTAAVGAAGGGGGRIARTSTRPMVTRTVGDGEAA